jgi:hypothetical protein
MKSLSELIVDELNRLLSVDGEAISKLFHVSVRCNRALELDPNCIVGGPKKFPQVRCLGVINSILAGCHELSDIAMEIEENCDHIKRFVLVKPARTK